MYWSEWVSLFIDVGMGGVGMVSDVVVVDFVLVVGFCVCKFVFWFF